MPFDLNRFEPIDVPEKDPFVKADQVGVRTQGRIVTLTGVVPKDAEGEMAELDAWYVWGVEDVRNEGRPSG